MSGTREKRTRRRERAVLKHGQAAKPTHKLSQFPRLYRVKITVEAEEVPPEECEVYWARMAAKNTP